MKRALAFTFAALLFGVAGLAQLSGSFSGEIDILPSVALSSITLELSYEFAGFTVTGTSGFDATGFISQDFSLEGAFGPVNVEGSMSFLPSGKKVLKDIDYELSLAGAVYTYQDVLWEIEGPAYLSSSLDLSMDFAGIALGLKVTHETNKVATFDEICGNLTYGFGAGGYPAFLEDAYTIQTSSSAGIYYEDWTLKDPVETAIDVDSPCCYAKYITAGVPEMLISEVKIVQYDADGDEVVSTVVSGPFEVAYFDGVPTPPTIDLTAAAADYLMRYIGSLSSPWDPTLPISFDVVGSSTTYTNAIVVWLDPDNVSLKFLLPSYMTYTFTAEVEPVTFEVVFDDVCTGIQFKEATITLSDLSLCCGLTYDIEAHFTKCEGFDYVKFSATNLFELCCGISFGVDVTFGVDYKKVEPKFTWGGVEGCVTVWGDIIEDGTTVTGWELYGYKLTCELAECYSIDFVEAFDQAQVNKHLEKAWKLEDDEFELIKLGACGPACCGGTWHLNTGIFFADLGTLFDISRIKVVASVPVMDNLSIDTTWQYSASAANPISLSMGWSFTF